MTVAPGAVRTVLGDVPAAGFALVSPHEHLIADSRDGAALEIRRTRAGDAWDRAEAASCEVPTAGAQGATSTVSLGLPALRVATIPIYDSADGQR